MKTLTQVIRENKEYKTLINAVIDSIGIDSIEDVNSHGIDGGFGGFVYYSDTHKFALEHRKAIVAMLENDAESMGEEVGEMVSHFGVFRNSPMDYQDKKDLYQYLGDGSAPKQGTITNLMAWYAAETVCRMFEN